VCVVKRARRHGLGAASASRPLPSAFFTRSSTRNAACPSLMWHTVGLRPFGRARAPPRAEHVSCDARGAVAPLERVGDVRSRSLFSGCRCRADTGPWPMRAYTLDLTAARNGTSIFRSAPSLRRLDRRSSELRVVVAACWRPSAVHGLHENSPGVEEAHGDERLESRSPALQWSPARMPRPPE